MYLPFKKTCSQPFRYSLFLAGPVPSVKLIAVKLSCQFQNVIFRSDLHCLKKSEPCQAKQKIICNITQSMKDTDFHFDAV